MAAKILRPVSENSRKSGAFWRASTAVIG
jgi:hypothetical protein